MATQIRWWTRWFDAQAVACGVSRRHDSDEMLRAALGSTTAITTFVAEIILNHERERMAVCFGNWEPERMPPA